MATMRQIRTRIRVAGNIAQITGAMEMVAAARLKRAQDRVTAARPYVSSMGEIVAQIVRRSRDLPANPLMEPPSNGSVGILAITGDRGLCGSYNSGVIRRTMDLVREVGAEHARLVVIGRKGAAFFGRRGFDVLNAPIEDAGRLGFAEAQATANYLIDEFLQRRFQRILIVYTRFISPIAQEPTVEPFLPMAPGAEADGAAGNEQKIIAEPPLSVLASRLIPRYLTTRVYQAMLESAASEHGARMTSMSSATDNASKMISTLTLELNRARQAAITKEISEIVSGAEALKS